MPKHLNNHRTITDFLKCNKYVCEFNECSQEFVNAKDRIKHNNVHLVILDFVKKNATNFIVTSYV